MSVREWSDVYEKCRDLRLYDYEHRGSEKPYGRAPPSRALHFTQMALGVENICRAASIASCSLNFAMPDVRRNGDISAGLMMMAVLAYQSTGEVLNAAPELVGWRHQIVAGQSTRLCESEISDNAAVFGRDDQVDASRRIINN